MKALIWELGHLKTDSTLVTTMDFGVLICI